MSIALVPCGVTKRTYACKASDMYIGQYSRILFEYAKLFHPDNSYIVSAKYGVISFNKIIEPYDYTLNNQKVQVIKNWTIMGGTTIKTNSREEYR